MASFHDQVRNALKQAPPLRSAQQRMLFGGRRRLNDRQIRVRIKRFLLSYPQYKPFLEPLVDAYQEP
jgi:hypothetical protein